VGRWARLTSLPDTRPRFLGVDGTGAFPDSSAEHAFKLMRAVRALERAPGVNFKLVFYVFECFSQASFYCKKCEKIRAEMRRNLMGKRRGKEPKNLF